MPTWSNTLDRLMRVLYQENKGVHLTVVDPDIVEDKNIGRQLFCDAEVGQPKAEAVARRYGHAWGLNVSSYVGKYDDILLIEADLTVLVGFVDNAEAREALNDTLDNNGSNHEPPIWWLDCGNLTDTGRVPLGTACEPDLVKTGTPQIGESLPDYIEDALGEGDIARVFAWEGIL